MQSRCLDLVGLDVALFVFAVAETVPVEEPAGAASALFAPLWVLVNVLVCKIYGRWIFCWECLLDSVSVYKQFFAIHVTFYLY